MQSDGGVSSAGTGWSRRPDWCDVRAVFVCIQIL